MFKLSLTITFLLSLSACITPPTVDTSSASEMEQVNVRLELLEQELSLQFAQSCDQSIAELGEKIDRLRKTKKTTKVIERCSNKSVAKVAGDKLLLGAIEKVKLSKESRNFEARIDTGADTSSLGVFNIKPFERDGKKWVRFSLEDNKEAERYEYPVFDRVKIKISETVTEKRLEIKIDIEMGGKKYKNQIFNLADRGFLDYQLLIGRSFLRDIAIVDVSRKKILRGN